jgi:hypothetical protein
MLAVGCPGDDMPEFDLPIATEDLEVAAWRAIGDEVAPGATRVTLTA